MAEGTPESKGGKPRTNADDAYATFMEMDDRRFLAATITSHGGLFFEVEERKGFDRACADRPARVKGEESRG